MSDVGYSMDCFRHTATLRFFVPANEFYQTTDYTIGNNSHSTHDISDLSFCNMIIIGNYGLKTALKRVEFASKQKRR